MWKEVTTIAGGDPRLDANRSGSPATQRDRAHSKGVFFQEIGLAGSICGTEHGL